MEGFIVIGLYAAIMLIATVLFTKKEDSTEGFLVGNRNIGLFRSGMSIAATWIWAPALFVSAEKAYTNGMPGLFWFLVPNVCCLLLFIPFGKKIRKMMPKGITLSGYMYHRYQSKKVQGIYWTQLTLLTVLSTAVQLLAGGKILSNILGIPFVWVTLILGAIAYSYSQFSGIRASVTTDAIQMIIMLAVCLVFIPWALKTDNAVFYMFEGMKGITKDYKGLFDQKGIELLLSFGLPTTIGLISGPFGDQCFWQRAFSIQQNKIGKSFVLGAVMFAVIPLSMGILGFIAAGSGYVANDAGIVNLELITHLFPRWALLPFLFMLISGLLSTVDSNLCAVSSLVNDLKLTSKLNNAKRMRFSRTSMLLLLLISTVIANISGLTVTHLFLFYGTLRATTLLPTVMTLCQKKLSAKGVFYGILSAFVIGLPIFAYGNLVGSPICKTVGSITTVLVSGIVAVVLSKGGESSDEMRPW